MDFATFARRRASRMLVCVATAAAAAATLAVPAAAGAAGVPISEHAVRRLETRVLGPAHAREHALERRATQRAMRRWHSLSPARRARIVRANRLALHAANVLPASEAGSWDTPFALPVHAIHSAVLPTGKVMIWSYPFQPTGGGPRVLETHAYLWDPSKGTGADAWEDVTPPADDISKHAMIFCGGGSLLADGRLLSVGGTLYWPNKDRKGWAGIRDVWTFDPWDETWTRQPDTKGARWYPTQTELPDGRTLILGGYDDSGNQNDNTDLEVFTPSADPHGVGSIKLYPDAQRDTAVYPHAFTMPNGKVLLAGQRTPDNAMLTITKNGPDGKPVDVFEWTETSPSSWRTQGNAVLEPGGPEGSTRVTLIGGTNPKLTDEAAGTVPPRDTTQTLDIAHLDDGWQPGSSMQIGRSNFNTVTLPDGSLVAVGGSNGTSVAEGLYRTYEDHRSRQVDIRDPKTHEWHLGAAQAEDRTYHSTAVLLPDGRILSGGDDRPGTNDADTGEIYSPPYLFRGPRPLIGAAPSSLRWGEPFRVGASGGATHAVLMAPGVTTHGTEMQARHVTLAITHADSSGLNAVAPPSAAVAPPGWYMLFLLNDDGVPSVSRWVHVQGTWVAPPPPHFGKHTNVSVVGDRFQMSQGAVRVKAANANAFRVQMNVTLRLNGPAAQKASLTGPVTAHTQLPAKGAATVVLKLGKRRAAFVRKHGHAAALVTLRLRDPAGNERTVTRQVTIVAPPH